VSKVIPKCISELRDKGSNIEGRASDLICSVYLAVSTAIGYVH